MTAEMTFDFKLNLKLIHTFAKRYVKNRKLSHFELDKVIDTISEIQTK